MTRGEKIGILFLQFIDLNHQKPVGMVIKPFQDIKLSVQSPGKVVARKGHGLAKASRWRGALCIRLGAQWRLMTTKIA
jgi:hypothetical protein